MTAIVLHAFTYHALAWTILHEESGIFQHLRVAVIYSTDVAVWNMSWLFHLLKESISDISDRSNLVHNYL